MNERKQLHLDGHLTGVAVPVSALKTSRGCGIGEFLDLPMLGDWCRDVGFSLIQILPVNDTGSNASPYSAVSAFALHPIYIRLQNLPEAEYLKDTIESFRIEHAGRQRVNFGSVLAFKRAILQQLFDRYPSTDPVLDAWIEANAWVRTYAVYKCLKERNDERSWEDWVDDCDLSMADIESRWIQLGSDARFHAWVQMHLERQLAQAVEELESKGIYLKGDIPILMNVDSADVWAHRQYFGLDYRAGAPPDMFATLGQAWGFPTYDWDAMRADDFRWWRRRLEIAARFYHAFRIDHVLGFFRIWSIPVSEFTAVLGFYIPSLPLSLDEVVGDSGIEHQLTRAWTRSATIESEIPEHADHVLGTYFVKRDSDSFELHAEICSERAIADLDEPEEVKEFLTTCHRDRTFLTVDDQHFVPAWYWEKSKAFNESSEPEQLRLRALVTSFNKRSGPQWLEMGRSLLKVVREASNMLPCAEDLGVVPPGLPEVLEELGILSLRIERWTLDPEGRLQDPSQFPYLSVSTPSVHDLSTMRGWWEETDWDKTSFSDANGLQNAEPWLTPETAQILIQRSLSSASAIRVFQVQDLFAITMDLRPPTPDDERINIPGTVADSNWSYVMPIALEELVDHPIGRELQGMLRSAGQDS